MSEFYLYNGLVLPMDAPTGIARIALVRDKKVPRFFGMYNRYDYIQETHLLLEIDEENKDWILIETLRGNIYGKIDKFDYKLLEYRYPIYDSVNKDIITVDEYSRRAIRLQFDSK